jgi:hypothetical protein
VRRIRSGPSSCLSDDAQARQGGGVYVWLGEVWVLHQKQRLIFAGAGRECLGGGSGCGVEGGTCEAGQTVKSWTDGG